MTTRPTSSEAGKGSLVTAGEAESSDSEAGFLLLGAIVLVALLLLVLSLAAPRVALELKREREIEAQHRANQYVRALRLYYMQSSSYPASLDQLEKSNNIRYLRQRYPDPLTGKVDWRLIPVGQNKTTVKGFFGQPLSGLGGGGLGSASGIASPGQQGQLGAGGSGFGGATPPGATGGGIGGASGASGFGSDSSFGSSSLGSNTPGVSGTPGTSNNSSTSSFGSGGGTSLAAPFMGIGLVKDQASLIENNGEKNYATWEFLYDPRIEQMYAKASLFGGGMASTNAGSLGSASGLSSGFGAATPGSGAGGANGPGGFGSSSGLGSNSGSNSSFGSSSGFGSPGTSGPSSAPPTTPQPQ